MCEPVAGGAANHHAEAAPGHHSSTKSGEIPNWLEEAEKIKAPPIAASEQQWFDYAEKVAAAADLPVGLVTDMIKSKGAPNALGGHAANDGTGEKVYGPLSVHGGLLEGGKFSDTTHGLTDSAGKALTTQDVAADPAKATVAGVQHIKQLVELYDGDITKALNHYETGDAANSDHALKAWCDGTTCPDDAGGHGASGHGASGHNAGGHHAPKGEDSGVVLKSSDIFEKLESAGINTVTESAGAGHHAAFATASHSAQSNAQNNAQHSSSQHSETVGGHNGGGSHAPRLIEDTGHGAQGHGAGGHHGHASNGGSAAATAKPEAASHAGHAAIATESAGSLKADAAGGGHAHHGAAKHGPTGLGTDRSLGEYITPDSHGPSQHIGESHGLGFLIHRPTHDAAMETVFGKPASEVLSSIQSTLENTGTYLSNKPETEKIKGAYLTGNMLMKQAMLPASSFGSEKEAGSVYGQAKLTAINGDAAGLKSLIESNGGNTLGLTDDQLLNVWATNEHNNLHGILNAGSQIGQTIHMTSLNDNAGDGTAKGTLGGYNDKGEYPQWGWFDDAQNISSLFGNLQAENQFEYR